LLCFNISRINMVQISPFIAFFVEVGAEMNLPV